jgi:oligopeptide/dipeptide ABC transporter ATP-binding protein
MTATGDTALLEVRDLCVSYGGNRVVDKLSFSVHAGETLCLAGESGSGKSQTALALMGLLPPNASVSGEVLYEGRNLLGAREELLNKYRARKIAMVFQDPLAALNPYLRIGNQLRRILIDHDLEDGDESARRALAMLQRVGLPDAQRQYRAYPHELSGGMRQRALIASALVADPALLIADEPTTALDVTVQAQILELLAELRRERNIALLLITHDLGVVSANSERLLVIDKGRLIDQGATRELFANPTDQRTVQMMRAATEFISASPPRQPKTGQLAMPAEVPDAVAASRELLRVEDLSVAYAERRGGSHRSLPAVQNISFSVGVGETVAIVGESGSGKTSLARAIVGLLPESSGRISFLGNSLPRLVGSRANATRRRLQMVFQDPVASLNPAMQVGSIVAEPLLVHEAAMSSADRERSVLEKLDHVGLRPELMRRYPHELSGGQAQRVAIARALILGPMLLICDEAVAALDGSVRQEILGLLQAEQQRSSLSLLVITHDLSVVKQLSHRVLVMYLGRPLELTSGGELFRRPRHPYTRLLLDSTPLIRQSRSPARVVLAGEPASILSPPAGCVFHPRCEHAIERCRQQRPELLPNEAGLVACHRAEELDLTR